MDANQFPFLDAQAEPSRFAQLTAEELAEYHEWLDSRANNEFLDSLDTAFAVNPPVALTLG